MLVMSTPKRTPTDGSALTATSVEYAASAVESGEEMEITLYEIGGCVRDELLGVQSKDIDFAAEITGTDDKDEAFAFLGAWMENHNFTIWQERPEYGCIRGKFPRGSIRAGLDADFVICRKDGPYSDGRHPDYVDLGTLHDDLARRDFSVNAMARPLGDVKTIIDPFDGKWDLQNGLLRFVGDPMQRLREDGLRALRAIRFMITKGFVMVAETRAALADPETATLLAGCHANRKREELERCFKHDSLATVRYLVDDLPPETLDAIMDGGLRLMPTMKE